MPYSKKVSPNYKGQPITSYTFKNIIIHVNNKIYMDINESGKRRSYHNWLSLSSNGLLYLCYNDGRLYFFQDKRKDMKLSLNDSKNQLSFVYDGDWEKDEDEDKLEHVEYPVSITFVDKDYSKLKKILNGKF